VLEYLGGVFRWELDKQLSRTLVAQFREDVGNVGGMDLIEQLADFARVLDEQLL
jgi:hypothetical protein